MKLLISIICILILTGCASSGPSIGTTPKASIAIADVQTKVNQTKVDNDKVGVDLENIAKAVATQPVVSQQVTAAITDHSAVTADITSLQGLTSTAIKSVAATEKTVGAQQKEITDLKAKNPLRDALYWIAGILIIAGVLGLIGSIVVPFLNSIPLVRTISVAAIPAGILLGTIAYYFATLMTICLWTGIAGVVVFGIWALLHYHVIAQIRKDIVGKAILGTGKS